MDQYHDRLLFVGLQGSYQREEAHPDSDIDAVVILDTLSYDDIITYRKLLQTMPHNDKSCGFISSKKELLNWPKFDLFQFKYDTRSYYGKFDDLLPSLKRQDVIGTVKFIASGLFHACSHTAVHSALNINILKKLYKNAFFLLQALHYLRTDVYIHNKKELLPLLKDDEYEILEINMHWDEYSEKISKDPDKFFELLLRWSMTILNTQYL